MKNPNNRNVNITFKEFRERAEKLRIKYESLAKKWEERTLTDFEYSAVIILMRGLHQQLTVVEDSLHKITTLYSTPKRNLKPIRTIMGK
jgi:hypothetical protein